MLLATPQGCAPVWSLIGDNPQKVRRNGELRRSLAYTNLAQSAHSRQHFGSRSGANTLQPRAFIIVIDVDML